MASKVKIIKDEVPESFSKYEQARIIGSRALQLSMGAPLLLKLNDEDLAKMSYNPIEIAKEEFKEGVIPITVKRPFPTPNKPKKKRS